MQKKFRELASREGNPNTITRREFKEGLDIIGIVDSDREILDRIFTMLDKTGDNYINFKEFITGISPLITGDAVDKLSFGFELYDLDSTGQVSLVPNCYFCMYIYTPPLIVHFVHLPLRTVIVLL